MFIDSQAHKRTLGAFFLEFCRKSEYDIPQDLFETGTQAIFENAADGYGEYAQLRHNAVMAQTHKILNELFSEQRSSQELTLHVSDNSNITFNGDLARHLSQGDLNSVSMTISLTPKSGPSVLDLLAHIAPIPKPLLAFSIESVTPEQLDLINMNIRAQLWKKGAINSMGSIPPKTLQSRKTLGQQIIKCICNEVRAVAPHVDIPQLQKQLGTEQVMTSLQNDFKKLMKARSTLSGIAPIEGVALFYRCLVAHPQHGLSSEYIDRAKIITSNCFIVMKAAEEIRQMKNLSDHRRMALLYELAKQIVSYIKENKTSAIIHTGSPIKPGAERTKHTLMAINLRKFLIYRKMTYQSILLSKSSVTAYFKYLKLSLSLLLFEHDILQFGQLVDTLLSGFNDFVSTQYKLTLQNNIALRKVNPDTANQPDDNATIENDDEAATHRLNV